MASKKKTVFEVLDDVIDAIKGNHSPHAQILLEIGKLHQEHDDLKAGQVRIEAALARIEEGLGEPPEDPVTQVVMTAGPVEEQP